MKRVQARFSNASTRVLQLLWRVNASETERVHGIAPQKSQSDAFGVEIALKRFQWMHLNAFYVEIAFNRVS